MRFFRGLLFCFCLFHFSLLPFPRSPFGPLISPIVYGGMDGVVSVFVGALIAVVVGEPLLVILSLTLAKLFSGAFSMGSAQLISSLAEVDYAKGERARETWECENFKEGEVEEMVELYENKGYTKETAQKIVNILAKNDHLFVNAMMIEELEISPDKESQQPLKNGLASFFAFMLFGTIPLLPFIVFIIGWTVTCPGTPCSEASALALNVTNCTLGESIWSQECLDSTWNSTAIPIYISIGLTVVGVTILALLKAVVTGIKVWVAVAQSFVGGSLSVAFGAGLAYAIFYATGATV